MKILLTLGMMILFGLTSAVQSSQLSQDYILTIPTGEFSIDQFVKKVDELNPFINIVTQGVPKARKIEFSKESRFKTVFRNLSQFQSILDHAENAAGGKAKFELINDRLMVIWSKVSAAPITEVTKGKSFTPEAGVIDKAYRINGTLVIDKYLSYDFKEPVVVDGDMLVDGAKHCEFGDLTINGRLVIAKGSKIKVDQLLIRGEVVVNDGATVETVDVIMDSGDIILHGESTLLLTDRKVTAN